MQHLWPCKDLDDAEFNLSRQFTWTIRPAERVRVNGRLEKLQDGDQLFRLCYETRTAGRRPKSKGDTVTTVATLHVSLLPHFRLFYSHFNTYVGMYEGLELGTSPSLNLSEVESMVRWEVSGAIARYLVFYLRLSIRIIKWTQTLDDKEHHRDISKSPLLAYTAYTVARLPLSDCWPVAGRLFDWLKTGILNDGRINDLGKNFDPRITA